MLKVARFAPDPHLRVQLASLALAASALLVMLWSGGLGCPMQRVFQRPCPTCGMSRALSSLMHGQLSQSITLQPLALPTAVGSWLVLGLAIQALWLRTPARELLRPRANRWLLATAGGVFAAVFWLWLRG